MSERKTAAQRHHEELVRIMNELDIKAARSISGGHAITGQLSDQQMLTAIHQERYESKAISAAKRLESAEFLRVNGKKRQFGDALLDGNQLP